MKNKTFYVVSAPMGAGKTHSFIEYAKATNNVLLAVPKIDLADEVAIRMHQVGIDPEVIHSRQGHQSSTVDRLSDALNKIDGYIVTTHASLLNVNPRQLKGWKVVVDEVPTIDNCKRSKTVPFSTFHRLFDGLVQVHDDGTCSIAEGVGDHQMDELYRDHLGSDLKSVEVMLGGLTSRKAGVSLEKRDKGYIIKSADYNDWRPVVENANEFHVMGNAVWNTLLYQHLCWHGFKPEMSPLTPMFKGYKLPLTLVPLVNGNSFSTLLMKTCVDGSDAGQFDETCLGWVLAEKAFEYHKGERLLFQCHGWMVKEKRFKRNIEANHKNVTITEFDVRGLNTYRSYSRTVNMIHGNPEPVEGRILYEMFDIMGLPAEVGMEAIKFERLIDPMAQHILRTGMRDGDAQQFETVTVLPTMAIAQEIQEALCCEVEFDNSIMIDPPEKKSKVGNGDRTKDELISVVCQDYKSGMKKKAIGEQYGISQPTVRKYINEMKKEESVQDTV
ncbi:DEAD/DEAH box helicase family protein [Halomonas denitrificans]|uniref:DEAD/DEAH box helicase family protein n=1 Tax=Halomonas denitrificans TaxID=370769 RepID=UPI001300B317|nr:DEAD/DEAH box helicase family protein [Halomonas denitrificans]